MEDQNPRNRRYESGLSTGVIALLGFTFIALLVSTGNEGQTLFSQAPDRMTAAARPSSGGASADSGVIQHDPSSLGSQDELTYRDYLVRITNRPSEGSLQIFRESCEVYARSAPCAFSLVGIRTGGKHLLLMGADVTGDSQPDLVIQERGLDARHGTALHLFEIGDSFIHLQSIPAGDSESVHFEDLDGSPGLEIVMSDRTLEGWLPGAAVSPPPRVVLRFDGTSYVFARDLMKREAPSDSRLCSLAERIRTEGSWSTGAPPDDIWRKMIDLIYAGNMTQALRLFDLAWPREVQGKDELLESFTARLKKSPYYQDILSISG